MVKISLGGVCMTDSGSASSQMHKVDCRQLWHGSLEHAKRRLHSYQELRVLMCTLQAWLPCSGKMLLRLQWTGLEMQHWQRVIWVNSHLEVTGLDSFLQCFSLANKFFVPFISFRKPIRQHILLFYNSISPLAPEIIKWRREWRSPEWFICRYWLLETTGKKLWKEAVIFSQIMNLVSGLVLCTLGRFLFVCFFQWI